MRSFVQVRSFPPEISNVPSFSVDFLPWPAAQEKGRWSSAEAECASEISGQVDLVRGMESRDIYLPGAPADVFSSINTYIN